MTTQDYDVIKEIPGYKVILKAVIKSQIQQLVEQLASNTEEESVILTASVADGTLSHLGSQFGKGFLEDHEDIKSQFLGFCLKSHHKRKQDEEKQRAADTLQQRLQPLQNIYSEPPDPYLSQIPTFQSPRGQGPLVRPVRMHKASPVRSPGVRFEPYHQTRPANRPGGKNGGLDSNPSPIKGDNSCDGQMIKIEPSSDNEAPNQNESDSLNSEVADSCNVLPSEHATQNITSPSGETECATVSDTSNASIHTTQTSDEPTCDSNTISEPNQSQNCDNSENDESVYVKMEAVSESEFELEITGVEPGRTTMPQDSWDSSVSMGMNFDPSQGAAGNQADLLPQGYSNRYICDQCGQEYKTSGGLRKHTKAHLGIASYTCKECGKLSHCRNDHEQHMLRHSDAKTFVCQTCDFCDTGDINTNLSIDNSETGKLSKPAKMTNKQALQQKFSNYFTLSNINGLSVYICSVDGCQKVFWCSRAMLRHVRTHTKEKPFSCRFCGFRSSRKDNLKVHEYKHVAQTKTGEEVLGPGHDNFAKV